MALGPRTWTSLTYLTSQDETKGGFTAFPALNKLKIKPDKGDCIIWPNAYDGTLIKDYRTYHAGTKVKYGKKYTLNQNFRCVETTYEFLNIKTANAYSCFGKDGVCPRRASRGVAICVRRS
eukprot:jgi/Bigna1/60056/fgenesh1_kg.8_\